jgi:hypothetical protein
MTCRGELFVRNPLDVTENYEHALDFALHLSRPFLSLDFSCTPLAFFSERLSNHCQGLRRILSTIFTQFHAVLLSDPSRNSIRPHTRLQMKGRKKSAHPPSWVKFCTLTLKICWYCHVPQRLATTTGVQITASVPEIMDITLFFYTTQVAYMQTQTV